MAAKATFACDFIRRKAPDLPDNRIVALAAVWDEVVDAIIKAMLAHSQNDKPELHVNVRAEMVQQLVQLRLFLTEKVVENRIGERDVENIDPERERAECFNTAGLTAIEETAWNAHEGVWRRKLYERWGPKSHKARQRESTERPHRSLSARPVTHKHFISKWWIRDHWAEGQSATRWRRTNQAWLRDTIPFGSWGYRSGLWGDRLEAGFALLEGEAKRPFEMLLRIIPLNPPQTQNFLAFLVIHFLRNPKLITALRHYDYQGLEDTARQAGMSVDALAADVFDHLFTTTEAYEIFARPLMASQWAVVTTSEPVFVLPDAFCAHGHVGESFRIIAPLTPFKCFVTLPATETTKRIAPIQLRADPAMAHQLSALLISAADSEFLAHSDFGLLDSDTPKFLDVLYALEAAVERNHA